jgi:hypothetical protein
MTTTITKAVIDDLIPVYLAGEASPETRRLVEAWAREHPEVLKLLDSEPADPSAGGGQPPADLGLRALDHTRTLVYRRNTYLAWAAASSLAIFSFVFRGKTLAFVVFRDAPWLAWALLGVSAILYACFYHATEKLVVTGLGAPHSKVAWGFGAAVASVPFTFMASLATGWELVRDLAVPMAFAGLALAARLNRLGSGNDSAGK